MEGGTVNWSKTAHTKLLPPTSPHIIRRVGESGCKWVKHAAQDS